ncbi:MAG: hypothetical protein AAF213_04710 [Pseudomonadota bacterium]
MVFDPSTLDQQGFSGDGWQSQHAETATVLGITDEIQKLADDARHAGPKTLATNMAEIARLHPKLAESYDRFRGKFAADSTEALANMDGENHPLMAADDAVKLIGVLAQNMLTRDGVQQVKNNLAHLRTAVVTIDHAVTSPDAPLPITATKL